MGLSVGGAPGEQSERGLFSEMRVSGDSRKETGVGGRSQGRP